MYLSAIGIAGFRSGKTIPTPVASGKGLESLSAGPAVKCCPRAQLHWWQWRAQNTAGLCAAFASLKMPWPEQGCVTPVSLISVRQGSHSIENVWTQADNISDTKSPPTPQPEQSREDQDIPLALSKVKPLGWKRKRENSIKWIIRLHPQITDITQAFKKEVSKGANSSFLFRNLCDEEALDKMQQTQVKFNARYVTKRKTRGGRW